MATYCNKYYFINYRIYIPQFTQIKNKIVDKERERNAKRALQQITKKRIPTVTVSIRFFVAPTSTSISEFMDAGSSRAEPGPV
ncbi:hypothetical protein ccbrp13_04350 [Ktedonobacteria bacterium brp13]|nr:hypothetical protein ccbrp13_04350 [Ktedonobacteria bacterium brp13]